MAVDREPQFPSGLDIAGTTEASRDALTDAGRMGAPSQTKDQFSSGDISFCNTLWDEKRLLRGVAPTAGTRGAADMGIAEGIAEPGE